MTRDTTSDSLERALVTAAIARLRARVMAVIFGTISATGLFLATVWLVIRGGEQVGPHLGLLGNYFPGYTVTVPGAFIGALYAAALGGAVGWTIAYLYNTVSVQLSGE